MRTLKPLALLPLLAAIIGAGPATRPAWKLSDKEIVAGYAVTLKPGKTRDGRPMRNGTIRAPDGGRVWVAIVGEEGRPDRVSLPMMTLVPGALQGNSGTLTVAQTIFCNVVDVEGEQARFRRLVRDLDDAIANKLTEVTADFGDVHVVLEAMPQPDGSAIDVTLTFTRKPG